MDIQKLLQQGILIFDGAMGTMLQNNGLPTGELPEKYNITHPEVVRKIHTEYVQAGSQVISTNTFQANPLKIKGEISFQEAIVSGVSLAKLAGAPYVALDIGPLGQLMEPMGTLSFEEAYQLFAQQMIVGEQAGADCILLETFSDLLEMKAAILAAKENTSLPVLCSLTYQQDGRTFLGCDPLTATLTLQGLGIDAFGVNCSLGPYELTGIVEKILEYSQIPVMVQANAGLPRIEGERTLYDITATEYGEAVGKLIEMGVGIVGGCCGTTPEYIRQLHQRYSNHSYVPPVPRLVTGVTSGSQSVILDDGIAVIGERINPTGKKKLKEALRNNQLDYVVGEAIDQTEAGSDILDVNVGLPEIDEPAVLCKVIQAVQSVSGLPLQIDSSDPTAIEAGVRVYNGRPLINSVNGKQESMQRIFPIAKKYGAAVVCLTLDETGIPATAEGRFQIAKKILDTAISYGLRKEDLVIDCLVLTASAQQEQVLETLKAIQLVKRELNLKTVLGVSNVSFGLPSREILNATFLAAAFGVGLDAPIMNPLSTRYMEVVDAYRVLNGKDKDAQQYLKKHSGQQQVLPQSTSQLNLQTMILQGRKDESGQKVAQMLGEGIPALQIIDYEFVPALNLVGERFEKGSLFLPQLMQSAEAVKAGFEVIKDQMRNQGEQRQYKGKILLATVEGDIHDIGKNIVKMILENYSYQVIDLGKDVPIEKVVQTIRDENIKLAGLSALMTTTVKSMKATISAAKEAGLDCSFMVGGAVLNPEYADFVGADYYAGDAMESVSIANRFFGQDQ